MEKSTRLVFILFIFTVITAVTWTFIACSPPEATSDISSSGFIESKYVAISLETGGRIVEIKADEGDSVIAGVPLVKLDDSLLMVQKQQAEASVKLAQTNLEEAAISREGAGKAWENALDIQNNPLELNARIVAAQGELDYAKLDLERIVEQQTGYWQERTAMVRVDIAQKVLDNLLLIREDPQEIKAAVDRTNTAYQVAVAAVKAAESQLEQLEASLQIIEVQLNKLTANSPISGVVAARYAEVGETIQPGVPVLTITELKEVTLTTYVPESKIGLVKVGQDVLASVDSYPGESFSGNVVYISPNALFTPRNIQLKEEREKTVFAVKIRLDNQEQKLKPGMPADATILVKPAG